MTQETVFELINNEGEEVTFTETQIINEVKRIIRDYLYLEENEDDTFTGEIYKDYRDEMSDDQVKKIIAAKPGENRIEAIFTAFDEYATESVFYEERNFMEEVERHWKDEDFGDFIEYQDFIQEWQFENVFFNFPYEDYLKSTEVRLNLVIDTGDGDYEYTLNNFLGYNGNGEIDDTSSIKWLVEQQGYTVKDLQKAIKDGTEDKFLKSVITELANVTTHMNALVFCIRMSVQEYIDTFTEDVAGIVLEPGTSCGLADFWSGAGSVLEIQCQKPIKIPMELIDDIHMDGARGYGIDDVYGMIGSFWTEDAIQEVIKSHFK